MIALWMVAFDHKNSMPEPDSVIKAMTKLHKNVGKERVFFKIATRWFPAHGAGVSTFETAIWASTE